MQLSKIGQSGEHLVWLLGPLLKTDLYFMEIALTVKKH